VGAWWSRTELLRKRLSLIMASVRRSVLVSVLFTLFGGPGIMLVYLPLAITRFRVPADEPLWQLSAGIGLIVLGLIPLLESVVRFVRVGRRIPFQPKCTRIAE
jgi:hypothetical protein